MKGIHEEDRPIQVSPDNLEALVLGGAILGGGGGGWLDEARTLGRLALEKGFSTILPLSSIPRDALLVTVSVVGAPSRGRGLVGPDDYTRAAELLIEKTGLPISGLISSEVGALGVVNGWVQSAALGLPVIDAPANGRAHPLGLMGSMGLHRKSGYLSHQAIVARTEKGTKREEIFISGGIEEVSEAVLAKAAALESMVAVARNPVPASFVFRNGAPGALKMALRLGSVFLDEERPEKRIRSVVDFFREGRVFEGRVERKNLRVEEGLDIGRVEVASGRNRLVLTFWNEFMTLEDSEKRLAMFPDLLMTFDAETALPLASAELEAGSEISLIAVPRKCLLLGAGVRDRRLLCRLEEVVAKAVAEPEGSA